eukprot:TRINITY_DN3870_c0_g1_i1.p1 TRINITY_DN3870_c0_g1~~TRINITY_DN3870_c0_g1_i1.p1  ORF type:complete len:449 (+),score=73.68 TRINITY_DN3870_c0_g1_i1:439-1785(+)
MDGKTNRILMGRYEMGRLLGKGAFAKVFQAKNSRTGESVAIKVMDKEQILRVGMNDQVKREIAIMKVVRHPNIVKLHEVMASKSRIYFVMEFVKGGELFNKIAAGKLKEDIARRFFQQLVSAVDFCHSKGVYHRDLKPENLLLDEDGNLKVTDFGLSAVSEQLKQDGLLHTTCGTPAYVAPEVIVKRGYDGSKADIWSCGVILFALMAGYLPFHDSNLMAMYKKILKGQFSCPKWFSPDVRRLLVKILDPNPRRRITTSRIMELPWFKKDFIHPTSDTDDDDFDSMTEVNSSFQEGTNEQEVSTKQTEPSSSKPTQFNAFDLISLSQGFDLSGLFEDKPQVRCDLHFTSNQPASAIILRLEELAKLAGFKIQKKDYRVKMQTTQETGKEQLSICFEIFEATSSLLVVEIKKICGNSMDYQKFCSEDLKSGLQGIVRNWQGDALPESCA